MIQVRVLGGQSIHGGSNLVWSTSPRRGDCRRPSERALLLHVLLDVLPLENHDLVTLVGLVTLLPLTLCLTIGPCLFELPYVTRTDSLPRSDP